MARHGILAKACEMTYTADKLAAYCDDYTKVNKDVMADIYKEIKETITKENRRCNLQNVVCGNRQHRLPVSS